MTKSDKNSWPRSARREEVEDKFVDDVVRPGASGLARSLALSERRTRIRWVKCEDYTARAITLMGRPRAPVRELVSIRKDEREADEDEEASWIA